jgi:hypothetical protein
MSLAAGTKLGPYEILTPLGARRVPSHRPIMLHLHCSRHWTSQLYAHGPECILKHRGTSFGSLVSRSHQDDNH